MPPKRPHAVRPQSNYGEIDAQTSAALAKFELHIADAVDGILQSNIVHVTQTAQETGAAAKAMQESSCTLVDQSETLRGEVDEFLTRIRVA